MSGRVIYLIVTCYLSPEQAIVVRSFVCGYNNGLTVCMFHRAIAGSWGNG